HVPGYAKLLIFVQTIVIFYFIFWSLEEYSNNYYFQAYVNSSLQGSGFALLAASSVGIFSAVAAGLFLKLRQTRKELAHIAVAEGPDLESDEPDSVLAPHVEQHLINMIIKTTPTHTASGSLPVLKRKEHSRQARDQDVYVVVTFLM